MAVIHLAAIAEVPEEASVGPQVVDRRILRFGFVPITGTTVGIQMVVIRSSSSDDSGTAVNRRTVILSMRDLLMSVS